MPTRAYAISGLEYTPGKLDGDCSERNNLPLANILFNVNLPLEKPLNVEHDDPP